MVSERGHSDNLGMDSIRSSEKVRGEARSSIASPGRRAEWRLRINRLAIWDDSEAFDPCALRSPNVGRRKLAPLWKSCAATANVAAREGETRDLAYYAARAAVAFSFSNARRLPCRLPSIVVSRRERLLQRCCGKSTLPLEGDAASRRSAWGAAASALAERAHGDVTVHELRRTQ